MDVTSQIELATLLVHTVHRETGSLKQVCDDCDEMKRLQLEVSNEFGRWNKASHSKPVVTCAGHSRLVLQYHQK